MQGFSRGGGGSTMSKLDKQKILHVYIVFILRINNIYANYREGVEAENGG